MTSNREKMNAIGSMAETVFELAIEDLDAEMMQELRKGIKALQNSKSTSIKKAMHPTTVLGAVIEALDEACVFTLDED